MTPDEIRARAVGFRNCGLAKDAELLEALADVYDRTGRILRGEYVTEHTPPPVSEAMARVAAIPA